MVGPSSARRQVRPHERVETLAVPTEGPLAAAVPYERRVESFPLSALHRASSRWLALAAACERAGDDGARALAERRLAAVLSELGRREAAARRDDERRREDDGRRYPRRREVSLGILRVPSGAALVPVRGGGRRDGR